MKKPPADPRIKPAALLKTDLVKQGIGDGEQYVGKTKSTILR